MRKYAIANSVKLRAVQAVFVGTLSVAASFLSQPVARADSKTFTTDRDGEAWFWSSNQEARACTPTLPVSPPNPFPDALCQNGNLSAAGPISPGHLGVSLKPNEQSDMRAYVSFDLDSAGVTFGSTVNSFVVTFTVSRPDDTDADHTKEHAAAKAPATSNESQAKIEACLVKKYWAGGVEGAPPADRDADDPRQTVDNEPLAKGGVDLNMCVDGVRSKTWKFDVTEMAKKWATGDAPNYGFVLKPKGNAAATDNWTVEFHGAPYASRIENPAPGGGPSQDLVYVNAKEAVKATVDFIPPEQPELPPITNSGPPSVSPPAVNPPPLPPFPSATETPGPAPTAAPALPVARTAAKNPWYEWLLFP
ncbi:MAG: hypothetical protein ABR548_11740, partial [Actinomycetota bacterium]